MITFLTALGACIVAGLVFALILHRVKMDLAAKDLELGGLAVEVERQKALAANMVTPLTWLHQESEGNRLARQAVVSAFTLVQSILLEDDQEMAKRIEAAPEPPRRLPKYPILPAYLASAEDVAMRGAPPLDGRPRPGEVEKGDPIPEAPRGPSIKEPSKAEMLEAVEAAGLDPEVTAVAFFRDAQGKLQATPSAAIEGETP